MLYKLMYSERILARHDAVRATEQQAFATFARLIGTQEGGRGGSAETRR